MKNLIPLFLLSCFAQQAMAQCWEQVSVGYTHTLAIAENGALWVWGGNHVGELGNGTTTLEDAPIRIGTDIDWNSIAAGTGPTSFNLAIKDNGTLWAWGDNGFGQVGDGTFEDKLEPVQIGTDSDWQVVTTGFSHALAIKENGTLWTWGNSAFFALGYGDSYGSEYHKNVPTQLGTASDWIDIAGGDRFSLAVKNNGTIWGWGRNSGNPLGINGNPTYIMTPTQTSGIIGTDLKGVACGRTNTFALKNNDLLVTWGSSVVGQNGGTTCAGCPEYFPKSFDSGNNTSAIVQTDGTLWVTGVNLGYTESTVQYSSQFQQIGNDTDWKMVDVGFLSAAAMKNDGSLWVWGWNLSGQLGIGVHGNDTHSLTLIELACPFDILATAATDTQVACDSYTWIDGNTYSANNNSATFTVTNAMGFDSLITLDLTINTSVSSIDEQNSCEDFIWIDGNTYTTDNNNATFSIPNGAANGCDSIIQLNLIITRPDVELTLEEDLFTVAQNNASYQWLNCSDNYASIAGATSQTFQPTFEADYAVAVATNGCVDTSACISFVISGTNQPAVFPTISIFPNPTNQLINIQWEAPRDASIKLFNLSGQLIYQQQSINVATEQIEFKAAPGIYLLEIITDNQKGHFKLIKH